MTYRKIVLASLILFLLPFCLLKADNSANTKENSSVSDIKGVFEKYVPDFITNSVKSIIDEAETFRKDLNKMAQEKNSNFFFKIVYWLTGSQIIFYLFWLAIFFFIFRFIWDRIL